MTVLTTSLADRFALGQRVGSHCASTALANVCSCYGMDLGEDLCFGLGQGLDFSYYKIAELSHHIVNGRSRDLVPRLLDALPFDVVERHDEAPEVVLSELQRLVRDEDRPVLVRLDLNHLPYLQEHLRLSHRLEMSEHVAVVVGWEPGTAWIAEYYTRRLRPLAHGDLLAAMGARFEPKSRAFQYWAPVPTEVRRPLPEEIAGAAFRNAHAMINGFGSNLGLPGLRSFAADLARWPDHLDDAQLRLVFRAAVATLDKVGTGGGNFRRLYSRFLREAAVECGVPALHTLAGQYADLARDWKWFAAGLDRAADGRPTEHVPALARRLAGLVAAEDAAAHALYSITEKQIHDMPFRTTMPETTGQEGPA